MQDADTGACGRSWPTISSVGRKLWIAFTQLSGTCEHIRRRQQSQDIITTGIHKYTAVLVDYVFRLTCEIQQLDANSRVVAFCQRRLITAQPLAHLITVKAEYGVVTWRGAHIALASSAKQAASCSI